MIKYIDDNSIQYSTVYSTQTPWAKQIRIEAGDKGEMQRSMYIQSQIDFLYSDLINF